MMWIIGLVCIIFLLLFMLSTLTCASDIVFKNNQLVFTYTIYLYRLRLTKKSFCYEFKKKVEVGEEQEESDQKSLWNFMTSQKNVLNILEKVRIHKLSWQTNIGTGDSSSTAILAGGLWSVKGTLLGVLCHKSHLRCEPSIIIKPHFNINRLDTDLSCIVTLKTGQAIISYFKFTRST